MGVDGVAGLEYSFRKIPLAFSVDYKPSLDVVRDLKLRWDNFGLGIKIIF